MKAKEKKEGIAKNVPEGRCCLGNYTCLFQLSEQGAMERHNLDKF